MAKALPAVLPAEVGEVSVLLDLMKLIRAIDAGLTVKLAVLDAEVPENVAPSVYEPEVEIV